VDICDYLEKLKKINKYRHQQNDRVTFAAAKRETVLSHCQKKGWVHSACLLKHVPSDGIFQLHLSR